MYNIDEIMVMLDWKKSGEIQQKGVELAKDIKTINVFIMPCNPESNTDVWENCAKILASKSDDILEPYVYHLLEWIADTMKPGGLIILERLKNFFKVNGNLLTAVEICTQNALADENILWLCALSELLDNEKLKAALPTEILEILQNHYHNWGSWDEE